MRTFFRIFGRFYDALIIFVSFVTSVSLYGAAVNEFILKAYGSFLDNAVDIAFNLFYSCPFIVGSLILAIIWEPFFQVRARFSKFEVNNWGFKIKPNSDRKVFEECEIRAKEEEKILENELEIDVSRPLVKRSSKRL